MRRILPILIMGIFSFLFGCNKKSSNDGGGDLPPPQSLEQKLEALASCGITLRPEFSVDDLLGSWDRAEYEEPGFNLTLVGIGTTQEEAPWTPRSENVWHFDTECIEDHGVYAGIAKRMVELAGGSLPLTDIDDHVDIEEGEAWLSFKLDGETIRIDCAVDDDWVDSKVFGHFVRLLAEKAPSKIYFHYDLGGQDCIIGCLDHENYRKLRKIIPKVEPLI